MIYNSFVVVCTNPAKSSAIVSCQFQAADWTEMEAAEEFCTNHGLELSEVRIEPIGDDGEVVVSWIHAPGEVDDANQPRETGITENTTMNDIKNQVVAAAKSAAATFVEEFGADEALHTTGDWDSAAYEADSCNWPDDAWPVYQSALLAEITRLQG